MDSVQDILGGRQSDQCASGKEHDTARDLDDNPRTIAAKYDTTELHSHELVETEEARVAEAFPNLANMKNMFNLENKHWTNLEALEKLCEWQRALKSETYRAEARPNKRKPRNKIAKHVDLRRRETRSFSRTLLFQHSCGTCASLSPVPHSCLALMCDTLLDNSHDGLKPKSKRNLVGMASNLLVMASNPIAMASSLVARWPPTY